jgi:D-arabinose 1-dehydrogenase-like Zn-dependent alcohol dehydrogenase
LYNKQKAVVVNSKKGDTMKKGEKLVIVGCSGSGGPAAMMSKKLMPEVDVTVIRKEEFFIVR